MKNVMLLICIFFSFSLKAQDIASFGKAPSTVVKLYNPLTGKQSNLETIGATRKQKKKLGGFGGVSFLYQIEREHSPIILNADSAIFVIQQGSGMMSMDMSMTITLYKLEIRNGDRLAIVGDYKPSLLGNSKTTDTKIITSSKQLKEGLTQIMPQKRLEKGEYAFISSMMEGNNYEGKDTKYLVYAFAIE